MRSVLRAWCCWRRCLPLPAQPSNTQRNRAAAIAVAARSQVVDCNAARACAQASPLHALAERAERESTAQAPRHYALILDQGQDALLARVNLIRSAQQRIDLQTYIFDKDDSARLVIDELLAAARRGVKVRVLIDQLSAIPDLEILAALSGAHANFQIRVYNPSFGKARLNYFDYAGSVLCCFRRFNQRMHTKLMLVDDRIGITGGRNYQDDYYDWDANTISATATCWWRDRRARDGCKLRGLLERAPHHCGRAPQRRRPQAAEGGRAGDAAAGFLRPERVAAFSAEASDAALVDARLVRAAMPVGAVSYVADLPQKHRRERPADAAPAVPELKALIDGVREEVLIQTPYLVLSDAAQEVFRELHRRKPAPRVIVSTNSLAATDNAVVYSMSFKYRRRYLREFGFQIYEYKPFPEDAPVDYVALMPDGPPLALESEGRLRGPSGSIGPSSRPAGTRTTTRRLQRTEPRPSFLSSGAATRLLPLKRAGVRMGLHAKSMVIDNGSG